MLGGSRRRQGRRPSGLAGAHRAFALLLFGSYVFGCRPEPRAAKDRGWIEPWVLGFRARPTPVVLLEAGAEPCLPLRLEPRPGAERELAVRFSYGSASRPDMPEYAVHGRLRARIRPTRARLGTEMDLELETPHGLGRASVFRPPLGRGDLIVVETGGKGGTAEEIYLGETIGPLEPAFPVVPVGPGARWRATWIVPDIRRKGYDVRYESTFELVERIGSRIRLRVVIIGSGAGVQGSSVSVDPGASEHERVVRYSVRGSGTLSIDLEGAPVPEGDWVLDTQTEYRTFRSRTRGTEGIEQSRAFWTGGAEIIERRREERASFRVSLGPFR